MRAIQNLFEKKCGDWLTYVRPSPTLPWGPSKAIESWCIAPFCFIQILLPSKLGQVLYKTKVVSFSLTTFNCFAESGGFEPPVRLPVRQFSKLLVSATHPTLRVAEHSLKCRCKINPFFLFSKEKRDFYFILMH